VRIARAVVYPPDGRVVVYLWPDPPQRFPSLEDANWWGEGWGVRLLVEHAQPNPPNWIVGTAGVWTKGPCHTKAGKRTEWVAGLAVEHARRGMAGLPLLGDESSGGESYTPRLCGDARDRILQTMSSAGEGEDMTVAEIADAAGLGKSTVSTEVKHMVKEGHHPPVAIGADRLVTTAGRRGTRQRKVRTFQLTDTGAIWASWERQAAAQSLSVPAAEEVEDDEYAAQAEAYAAQAAYAARQGQSLSREEHRERVLNAYTWSARELRGRILFEAHAEEPDVPFADPVLVGVLTMLRGPGDDRPYGDVGQGYATVSNVWIHPGHGSNDGDMIGVVLHEKAAEAADALGLRLASRPMHMLPGDEAAFWSRQGILERADPEHYLGHWDDTFAAGRYFLHRPPPESLANPRKSTVYIVRKRGTATGSWGTKVIFSYLYPADSVYKWGGDRKKAARFVGRPAAFAAAEAEEERIFNYSGTRVLLEVVPARGGAKVTRRRRNPMIALVGNPPPGDRGRRELERRLAADPGDVHTEAALIRDKISRSELFEEQVWLLSVLGDPAAALAVPPLKTTSLAGAANWTPPEGTRMLMLNRFDVLRTDAGPMFGILAAFALVEHAKAIVLSHDGLDGVGLAFVDEVLAGTWRWLANVKGKWLGEEGVPIRDRYPAHMDHWMEASRTIFDLEVVGLGDQRCGMRDVQASNPTANLEQVDIALKARCAARHLARATAKAQTNPMSTDVMARRWDGEVRGVFNSVVRANATHRGVDGYRPEDMAAAGQVILARVKPWVMARGPAEWEVPPP
jgi:hypothetical protein